MFRVVKVFRALWLLGLLGFRGPPPVSCWSFLSSSRRHLSSCSCPQGVQGLVPEFYQPIINTDIDIEMVIQIILVIVYTKYEDNNHL